MNGSFPSTIVIFYSYIAEYARRARILVKEIETIENLSCIYCIIHATLDVEQPRLYLFTFFCSPFFLHISTYAVIIQCLYKCPNLISMWMNSVFVYMNV